MTISRTYRSPGEFINVRYVESPFSDEVFIYTHTLCRHFGGLSDPGNVRRVRFEGDETQGIAHQEEYERGRVSGLKRNA